MNWLPMLPALLFSLATQSPNQGESQIRIEPLQKSEEISGCGLAVSLASATGTEWPQVFGYFSHNEDAYLRVNGVLQKVRMKSRKVQNKSPKGSAVGDRVTETWGNARVLVVLDYKVSAIESEGVEISGTLTVTLGKSNQSFKVKGSSGC